MALQRQMAEGGESCVNCDTKLRAEEMMVVFKKGNRKVLAHDTARCNPTKAKGSRKKVRR
jgi:hypothetical protein